MKKYLINLFFLILGITSYAQESFINRISNPTSYFFDYDNRNDLKIVALPDGGYVSKFNFADKNGQNKMLLYHFDACQNFLWKKYINAPPSIGGSDANYSRQNTFINTEDHGYLIVCQDDETGRTGLPEIQHGLIVKLDSNGKSLWARKMPTPLDTGIVVGIACTQGVNHDYIISATIDQGDIYNEYLIVIICLDNNGKTKWIKQYSNNRTFYSFAISQIKALSKGGYAFLLSGKLLKTDTLGNLLWSRNIEPHFVNVTIGRPDTFLYSYYMASDTNDNLYLASNTSLVVSPNTDISKVSVFKIDKDGTYQWLNFYMDTLKAFDNLCGIVLCKDQNLVLMSIIMNTSLFRTFKINLDGDVLWNHLSTIKDNIDLPSFSVESQEDSGFISAFNVNNARQHYIVKQDKNGRLLCNTINAPLNKKSVAFSISNLKFNKTIYNIQIHDTVVNTFDYANTGNSLLCSSHPYPHVNLGRDTILCKDSSYILHADSGNVGCHFLWSTGDTTSTIIVKKSGRYWLKVYYGYCSAYDTVNITLFRQYKSPLGKDKGICTYDSLKLLAPDTFGKWYWLTPAHKKIYANNITTKDSGLYYLGLNGNGSCTSVDTFHLSYYPKPKSMAGPDTLLCYNQEYTMQGAGGATYKWTPAKFLSSDTIPNPKAHLPNNQRYALIVHSAQGCVDTSYVTLEVRTPLKVKIGGDTSVVCYGKAINLIANGQGGYAPNYKFTWPDDSAIGKLLQMKLYKSTWHKVVLNDGCSEPAVDSIYMHVAPKLKAAFMVLPGLKVNARAQLNFQNQSTNALHYYWTFGLGGNNSIDESPYYFYTDTGAYEIRLVAYGYNDCSDTAYGRIEVIQGNSTIYIPNAFTPNRDDLNEVFDISGTEIKEYTLEIYNRWGERIFIGGKGWDGTYHGVPSPEGVYLYTVRVTDNFYKHHFFSGTVHLLK